MNAKWIIALILACLFCVFLCGHCGAEDPKRPPTLGYYDPNTLLLMNFANGSVTNDWTRRNTPTVSKAPTVFQYSGGNYVHFDGGATVTNIDSGFTPTAAQVSNSTCTFWFRFTNDTAATKDAFGSVDTGGSYYIQVFDVAATAGRYGGSVKGESAAILQALCTNLSSFTDNNWHFWSFVVSNYNACYQYIDGVQQANISASSNQPAMASYALDQSVWIGARTTSGTAGQRFNGDLSDIRVISAAYGQPEIQKLMQDTYRK